MHKEVQCEAINYEQFYSKVNKPLPEVNVNKNLKQTITIRRRKPKPRESSESNQPRKTKRKRSKGKSVFEEDNQGKEDNQRKEEALRNEESLSESSFDCSYDDSDQTENKSKLALLSSERRNDRRKRNTDTNSNFSKSGSQQNQGVPLTESIIKAVIENVAKAEDYVDIDEIGPSSVIEELPGEEEYSDSDVEQKISISNEEDLKYKVPINLLIAAQNILR